METSQSSLKQKFGSLRSEFFNRIVTFFPKDSVYRLLHERPNKTEDDKFYLEAFESSLFMMGIGVLFLIPTNYYLIKAGFNKRTKASLDYAFEQIRKAAVFGFAGLLFSTSGVKMSLDENLKERRQFYQEQIHFLEQMKAEIEESSKKEHI